MALEALERITQKIKTNLQDSSQRSHENLQMLKERELKQTLSEGNPTHMRSLDNFGEPNARFGFSVKCSKCSDTGWILKKQEHMQPIAIACECMKIEKLKNEWKYSGINVEQSKLTFSSFKVWNEASQRMKDTAAAYCTDFDEIRDKRRNSILLCGQVGSGKSHSSIAVALNLLKQRIKVVYMPYRDVVTKIKQNMIDEEVRLVVI